MTEHRRRFSPQFKAEAVQVVTETGKPIAEVARDLGINDGTLGNLGVPGTRGGRLMQIGDRPVRWPSSRLRHPGRARSGVAACRGVCAGVRHAGNGRLMA